MSSENTGSFWQTLIHDWPLLLRFFFALIAFSVVLAIVIVISFLIVEGNRDIEIGITGIKSKRSETVLERNCRNSSEMLSLWNQNINSEILALEQQVSIKDHDLSEVRQKCLTVSAEKAHTNNKNLCRTENFDHANSNKIMGFSITPQNEYETELGNIAWEREILKLKIADNMQERRQRQQRFENQCLKIESNTP